MKGMTKTVICLVLVLFSCKGANQVDSPDPFAKIRRDLEQYCVKTGVPSLAVAVAKDGEIVWEEGFGMANIEKNVRSTPHTCYPIASINKNLTATALLTLVEKGDVSLDLPANDYLGDIRIKAFRGKAEDATVRRLLQHTAGIPLHYEAYYPDQLTVRISQKETIRRFGILTAAPGYSFIYSSLGYGIIEYIIARVSGRSYADYMTQDVFEPLRMSNAVFLETLPDSVAIEYKNDGSPAQFALGIRHGGEIYCSSHDLVRYCQFHLKNHLNDQKMILSDSLIDLMRNDFDSTAENAQYALGWRLETVANYQVFSHNGGGLGCDTRIMLIPSEDLAVVVLANSRRGNSTAVSYKIVRALLPDFRRSSWRDRFSTLFRDPEPKAINPGELLTGEWKGYITTFNEQVAIDLIVTVDGYAKLRRCDDQAVTEGWINARRAISIRDGIIELMFEDEVLRLDENRPERYLLLRLFYDGTFLYGSANAGNSTELIYCVPSYVELSRTDNPH
ncbi:beta-lactamase family protein [candidate division KSB1 bacterium]|nr:beta-lactamase family protein [candidate division KSB1 bacterium]